MSLVREYPDSYLAAGIAIGNFEIRFYALCILFGMIMAIAISLRESKKFGINTDDIFNGAVFGIILGIIGARIYYVIFEWSEYSAHPSEIFAIWNGGLAIHGGIIVAFVYAIIYCRVKKINILAVIDMVAIGLLIGQICGRWGNFFNQEAHGGETTLAFLESLHLPTFIIKQMCINGTYYHPTFLYESLWNLVALVAILILRRTRTIRLGDCAGIYLIWYGIGRFWIEGMRTDSLMIGSIKQNQLISIVLIVLGIAYLLVKYLKIKPGYYMDYIDVDFEPVINKEMVTNLNKVTTVVVVNNEEGTSEKVTVVKEKKDNVIVSKFKNVINKEDEVDEKKDTYEIPEELDKNAPFRKSKYIVDNDDEE